MNTHSASKMCFYSRGIIVAVCATQTFYHWTKNEHCLLSVIMCNIYALLYQAVAADDLWAGYNANWKINEFSILLMI